MELVVEVALDAAGHEQRAKRAVSSRGDSCAYASLMTRLDRVLHPVPLTRFDGELLPSRRRQPVVLGPPAELGHLPLGFDPALMLEPVQGRVERALVDLEHVLGNVLDALGDRPAMERVLLQRAKDQQVQRSGEQIWGAGPLVSTDDTIGSWCRLSTPSRYGVRVTRLRAVPAS